MKARRLRKLFRRFVDCKLIASFSLNELTKILVIINLLKLMEAHLFVIIAEDGVLLVSLRLKPTSFIRYFCVRLITKKSKLVMNNRKKGNQLVSLGTHCLLMGLTSKTFNMLIKAPKLIQLTAQGV
jgi:hypothetical protein